MFRRARSRSSNTGSINEWKRSFPDRRNASPARALIPKDHTSQTQPAAWYLGTGSAAMTANQFRKIALAVPESEERAHMSHPDFRVAGKIFATLGYPDKSRAMVKLSL